MLWASSPRPAPPPISKAICESSETDMIFASMFIRLKDLRMTLILYFWVLFQILFKACSLVMQLLGVFPWWTKCCISRNASLRRQPTPPHLIRWKLSRDQLLSLCRAVLAMGSFLASINPVWLQWNSGSSCSQTQPLDQSWEGRIGLCLFLLIFPLKFQLGDS